jgi:hypothetical protein
VTSPREEWSHLAADLTAIEDRYRKERLRVGSVAQPKGEAHERLVDLLEATVKVYLHGDEGLRREKRGFFAAAACVPRGLLPVAGRFETRIQDAGVGENLRLAIAAIALENFHQDYRDSLDCLSRLYQLAHARGIDPQSTFNEISALSSASKDHGYSRASMHDVLSGFDKSDYFKADVQRKLKSRVMS